MHKIKLFFITSVLILMISGCQTIKEKTDSIVEKENEKLSKYIGKPLSNLQMDLGKPDEDFKNEKGNLEVVYNTKKYGILCERRFEIDSNSVVVGFVSNGCF
ncbi:hypothetical protein [Candidatus Pelagibacter bacterium nBUS_36]|uniref:hypothetical protein n=1 Tax=Candidatus Pelagibacter bacterium nBUS_36 TaxID=3374194 RepID=UPI003EBC21EF